MTEKLPLITRYRPATWEDVVGQDAACATLASLLEHDDSQAFLLTGPSGVGKTTLARIAAAAAGCQERDIMDLDAATHTGIDSMRAVQDLVQYMPFGGLLRAVIVDECHALSQQAWKSLLKVVEEPPTFVLWFFCTTEPGKVPATVKTRCTEVTLRLVDDDHLRALLERVCHAEGMSIPERIETLVVREAHGSPRQMLVNVGLVRGLTNAGEAAKLLRSAVESDHTLDLCRALAAGWDWRRLQPIIGRINGEAPESVRIVVLNYMAAVMANATDPAHAAAAMQVMEAFERPYDPATARAGLLLSIGRLLRG